MAKKFKISSKQIMASIIAFIMVFSIFGGIIGSLSMGSNDIEYNGFKIKQVSNYYKVDIDGKTYSFYRSPGDLSDIIIDSDVMYRLKMAQGYSIVFDPNAEDLQTMDIIRFDLSEYYNSKGIYVNYGLLSESSLYPQITSVLSCENATQYMPIIIFKDSDVSNIVLDSENPNCIIANSATPINRVMLRDALLYRYLGIITN